MKETVEKIINYLNIGYSPTILSFPDDGIIHLYDELSSLKQKPQNYDLPYIFLYLSTQSFKSLDIERLESAVELEIGNISDGRSIIEILKKGFEIVVIIDDMEVFGDSYETVAAIDGLIKKYQNKIKFVYLIEYPNIDLKFPDPFPTSSSIFDATIHFKIGSWTVEEILKYIVVHGTNLHLDTQIISDISKKSNNHFGTFKRLYRDFVLDSNHSEDYYKFLINNFSTEEIATFKKKNSGIKLNPSEIMIQNMYKKVSFVKEDQLSIPILAEKINDYKIKNVVEGSTERLAILDAGALTLTEKAIIEYMHKNIEVSKDQLALILWGDDANEKYSEWAMEQRMSRLRKKIQKMGYNINIETLYNKGYKLIIN